MRPNRPHARDLIGQAYLETNTDQELALERAREKEQGMRPKEEEASAKERIAEGFRNLNRRNKQRSNAPVCFFCKRSGGGVAYDLTQLGAPRRDARLICVDCEQKGLDLNQT